MQRLLATLCAVAVAIPPSQASVSPAAEQTLLAWANSERAAAGLPPLTPHHALASKARAWSSDLAAGRALGHALHSQDLGASWDRLAENVGSAPDLASVHRTFMRSATHRGHILDPALTHIGTGVTDGSDTVFAVAVFGAPTNHDNSVVGIASTRTGRGAWLVRTDGSVERRGDARPLGSAAGKIGAPVAAMASTTTNRGFWLLDQAGGVHTFGDARYYGSVPALRAAGHPIGNAAGVSIISTPSGQGYWILDAAGGIFTFGDARFYGSLPGLRRAGHEIGPSRTIGMAPTRGGRGYWILDSSGGIFTFGDARFYGSVPGLRTAGHTIGVADMIGMAPSREGRGYWLLDSAGGVFGFGRLARCGRFSHLDFWRRRVAGTATDTENKNQGNG